MRSTVRQTTAAILALAACIEANQASAQTLFGGYNTTGYAASATSNLPPTSVNANLTFGSLAKGPGITAVTTANVFGGAGWTNAGIVGSEASSITHGLYITYTVAANAGYTISFTTNVMYYHNSATGPWTGELQYSTDGVNYSDVASLVYSIQPNPAGAAVTGALTNNLSGVAALQNIPSTTMNYFRIVNWGAYSTAGTWYVNDGAAAGVPDLQVIGKITSPGVAPTITGITPSPIIAGSGNTVAITVTATGDTPSYFWYKGALGSGTLIPTATTATLTLSNVTGTNAGSYYVVLSNATPPMATSSVVTVSIIDPFITLPPNNAEGFLGGQSQFAVTAVGTSPSFAWYQSNASGNWTLITNGLQPSGSTVSGQGTTNLVISNVQYADSNNFANIEVLASGAFGTNTSPPASLLNVSSNGTEMAQYVFNGVQEITGVQDGLPNSGIIAQWNFNGTNFTNPLLNPAPYTGIYNPAAPAVFFPQPWVGVGSGTAVGCVFAPVAGPSGISPYDGALSAGVDGMGYSPLQPNGSFGTENYPLTGSNKLNGVQFMTSTVGAKNIAVSYYLRETGTSSLYTRLQYTTNAGLDWTDYPASSIFPGIAYVNLYAPVFVYDLSGFPGAANNPDFGIQVVTEYQSTATYGIGSQGGNPLYITNGYVGCDNLYSSGGLPTGAPTTSAGTLTFDLITIGGQPLNEAVYSPPTISPITNSNVISPINTVTDVSVANGESNYDFVEITNTFTIGSAISPVSNLLISAQSLNSSIIYPGFSFTLNGSNVTMVITPNSIPDPLDAAPIVVTVMDTNSGDSTVEWFLLTLQSLNLPPTNSLTSVTATNMLANSTLNIPFYVGSYDGNNNVLTYSSNSLNNTVIPATNLALTNLTLTNVVFSITPGSNQLGQGVVSATVFDNNPVEPRFTTATFPVMVRPNTNVILIDYFNYDQSGPLETVSYGYWSHLTGNENQVQVGNGPVPDSVTIDSVDYTETVQAPLLGAPYNTNAGTNIAPVLYASYVITADALPITSGGYITAFNDGTGNAGGSANRFECGLYLQTNGASANHYQVGIANFPVQEGGPAATWSQDLSVGKSYVIVTALNVSNGFSTLWVNPVNQSSSSVRDTTTAVQAGATNVNISDFTLHEGTAGGVSPVSLSTLKVGTTFDSVLPTLHIQLAGPNVVLTWSDPTLSIQAAPDLLSPWVDLTGATTPYTNSIGTNTEMFFRFGQ